MGTKIRDFATSSEYESYPILVVDDDKLLLEFLRNVFAADGHEVLTATNGGDALAILKEKKVALVLADMIMPGMDGVTLLTEIKKQKNLRNVPVIIMTGRPSIEAAVDCVKVGAYDYLSKPFDLQKLKSQVESALADASAAHGDNLPMTTEFLSGGFRSIAGYEVRRILGEGSMGTVFLVERDEESGRNQYALKLLKPKGITEQENRDALERFVVEAEVASRIKHPHIVGIVDFGVADEIMIPYIIMEYVDGQSLKELIRNKVPLNYQEKATILRQVAQALAEIHRFGVCHRDVKPDNIILDKNYRARVTDFGIAQMPESDLTVSSRIMGAPYYLSPEGFCSAKVDHRSDIFSLGVVSYEFYLGRRPFEADSLPRFSTVIQTERPMTPRKIDPNFPFPLQTMLAKMLKKDPADRYHNADAIVDDLDAFLKGEEQRPSFFKTITGKFIFSDWS